MMPAGRTRGEGDRANMPIWAMLVHLGYNMWEDTAHHPDPSLAARTWSDALQCEDLVWEEVTQRMSDEGLNGIVIDLADGIRYDSHPEISVTGAWTVERLRDELVRLRQLGLEPYPKLNFSAGHDAWLRDYSRQVSTATYYQVCTDLISEVCSIFDRPPLFHLGMDEETAEHQRFQNFTVVRRGDLWWHDLHLLADAVTAGGSRPWIWSDYAWNHPDEYYRRMPHEIMQSNWFYSEFVSLPREPRPRVLDGSWDGIDESYLAYLDLADHGYEHIPTGSSFRSPDNFRETVRFCRDNLPQEGIAGYLQTVWRPTTSSGRQVLLDSAAQVGATIREVQSS